MNTQAIILTKEQLKSFVPHTSRMFILDGLIKYSTEVMSLTSFIDIDSHSMFWDDERQGIPAYFGFEYMAQSIAALSGLLNHSTRNGRPRLGMIMAVRDFSCAKPLLTKGRTFCEVLQIFRDKDVVSFEGKIYQDNQFPIADAIINAIEVDESFLKNKE